MAQCIPVIMSGGAGTRLWPASRRDRPKQFLPLVTERSMFTETLARVPEGPLYAAPIIVGSAAHDTLIRGALDSAGVVAQHILLEPEGRNTAAAICLAALQIGEKDMGAAMLVLPSDHVVADKTAFDAAIQTAITAALDGAIVTFGIVPDGPETGYGYIRAGDPRAGGGFGIHSFTEKPDRATAEAWLAEGGYSWNSGIFMFTAESILAEMQTHCPEILAACRAALAGARVAGTMIYPDATAFTTAEALPIDIAVMEKTQKGVVLPVDMGWNDVGSWSALWQSRTRDSDDNALHGDTLVVDARNNFVFADSRLVVLAGMEDVVVIETQDAVLVMPKSESQRVKQVVETLKQAGRAEARQMQPKVEDA